jgi:DNA-binding NarL/FixJ family response regulator
MKQPPNAPPIRVGLVDDDPSDRADILRLIEANAPTVRLELVAESLATLRREKINDDYQVDVLLVDLFLGINQPDGLAVIDYLHSLTFQANQPIPKLLIVSANVNNFSIELSRKSKANGVVRKNLFRDNPGFFIKVVQQLHQAPAGSFNTWLKYVPDFGLRQQQVLCGLCKGQKQAQIAEQIGITESTVNTYTQKLRHDLGGPSMTLFELTAKAKEWCCIMK